LQWRIPPASGDPTVPASDRRVPRAKLRTPLARGMCVFSPKTRRCQDAKLSNTYPMPSAHPRFWPKNPRCQDAKYAHRWHVPTRVSGSKIQTAMCHVPSTWNRGLPRPPGAALEWWNDRILEWWEYWDIPPAPRLPPFAFRLAHSACRSSPPTTRTQKGWRRETPGRNQDRHSRKKRKKPKRV
jgi:hypothetical protein